MGALINFVTIIVGGLLGTLLKKKVHEDLTDLLLTSMAVSLIFVSIIGIIPTMITIDTLTGKLSSQGILCLIISMFLGSLIGYFLKLSTHLDRFGGWVERKLKIPGFSQGFVPASLFFCVGAMAIVGSIQEGVYQNYNVLICKSIIDFVTALALGASLGYGVIFGSIPILIYEGGLTLGAHLIESSINTPMGSAMLNGVCMVGYVIIFAIALNMMKIKKINSGDLIPAMLIPLLFYWITYSFNITNF